ncbi:MAG: two pore domain potassium channel family protein [Solobacterium sp.]|nr:two pore domain potassium channel family protein [Solobacterium sp.]
MMFKRVRILARVLKETNADRLILSFVLFLFIIAFLIMLVEPGINTYGDALWYCYAVFSTCGFGDFAAATPIGRILSILITISGIFVVALVTGVVVAFFNEVVAMKYKASKAEILDQLSHLDTLSREELEDLSRKVRSIT